MSNSKHPEIPVGVQNFFASLKKEQNQLVDQQSKFWAYDFNEHKPIEFG